MIKPRSLRNGSYKISPVRLSICVSVHWSEMEFSQDLPTKWIFLIFWMMIFCHIY